VIVVSIAKDALQEQQILLDRRVLLPSQHQNGHARVLWSQGLLLNMDSSVLEMSRKGLELVAFRGSWRHLAMGIVLGGDLKALSASSSVLRGIHDA